MHEYHCINDLYELARSDPDLWREIHGYMQVCLYEADLQFLVATAADIPPSSCSAPPEETATIIIRSQGETRTIHRIIHPTEVIFLIDTEIIPKL